MSWLAMLADTMTGQLLAPIDLPSFNWSISVSDSALATTRDKGTGAFDASGLKVPWSNVPASDAAGRAALLSADKRGVVLFWRDGDGPGELGVPVLFGSIGQRTDSWLDTSFSLNSVWNMLGSRYFIREGVFGNGKVTLTKTVQKNVTVHSGKRTYQSERSVKVPYDVYGVTSDKVSFKNMSWRGIAAEVGYACTSGKPGGELPIDWNYRGEKGKHSREFKASDVRDLSCEQIFTDIANGDGGPDMQFRPYLTDDGRSVRLSFLAGSDGDVYLGQKQRERLYARRYGGDLENVQIDHAGPVQRVYAAGKGSDEAQKEVLVEDRAMLHVADPWPLREMTYSNSDDDTVAKLRPHANAVLEANRRPLMQIKGEIDVADRDASGAPLHPFGSFWTGETVEVALDGFPSVPDDVYACRLMEMSGDESSKVSLTFDVMRDPIA